VNARHDAGTGLADIPYAAFADTDPSSWPRPPSGSNQEWVFDGSAPPGFWRTLASSDILKATFDGGPIVSANTEPSSNPNELWTFKTP